MVALTPTLEAPVARRSAMLMPEVHAWAMERPALVAAGLTRGMTVVDLGCGAGGMTRFLSGEVGPEGRLIGIDVDERVLQTAASTTSARVRVPVTWEAASAYETGLPDASVDFVVARQLFQHLTDPARALGEIARILKPGGRVCILDTHDALLWLQPEPQGHTEFVARAAAQQRMRGGDREIGRKLAALMTEADLDDVRADVHVFDTSRIPMDLFIELALVPMIDAFPGDDAETARAHVDRVRAQLAEQPVHGSCGFYAVSARRSA